jgi:hypothetical protein
MRHVVVPPSAKTDQDHEPPTHAPTRQTVDDGHDLRQRVDPVPTALHETLAFQLLDTRTAIALDLVADTGQKLVKRAHSSASRRTRATRT